MSFGMWLAAVFCSPLYFAIRGRWIAAFIHSGIYFTALMTIILGIGFFFWFIGTVHACWDLSAMLREEQMQRQAALIAQKMNRNGQ